VKKNFTDLQPLTPGSTYVYSFHLLLKNNPPRCAVHGYSLLRTQLNNDYFHERYDESAKFAIEIEGHRMYVF